MGSLDEVCTRPIQESDLDLILSWCVAEGWNCTRLDLDLHYQLYKDGFTVAEIGGRPVGCVFGRRISDNLGYLDLFIVEREHRGNGIGRRLLDVVHAYLELSAGVRKVYIKAATQMIQKYFDWGYESCHWRVMFYTGVVDPVSIDYQSTDVRIVDITDRNIKECALYAEKIHQHEMSPVLQMRMSQHDVTMKAAILNDQIVGYGVLRPFGGDAMYGLWLYADNEESGCALAAALVKSQGRRITLDMHVPRSSEDRMNIVLDAIQFKCTLKCWACNIQSTHRSRHFTSDKVYAHSRFEGHPI